MDGTSGHKFSIQREGVARYFYITQILMIIAVGVWFLGIGLILAVIHAFTFGPWLTKKQSHALAYWLDGETLRVDQGVFFLKRKAVPLDRVTDVVLAQGPLMRLCGIWELRVQTAGTGQTTPEASLYGVAEPEEIRDLLLAARDKAAAHRD